MQIVECGKLPTGKCGIIPHLYSAFTHQFSAFCNPHSVVVVVEMNIIKVALSHILPTSSPVHWKWDIIKMTSENDRGNDLRLRKPVLNMMYENIVILNRVVNMWNSLPNWVTSANLEW